MGNKTTHLMGGLWAKVGMSFLLLALVGTAAGVASFSAFSSETTNDANTFTAGTVYVSDNDAGGLGGLAHRRGLRPRPATAPPPPRWRRSQST